MPKVTQKRVTRWLAGFVVWTLLGLAFASQFYFSSAQFGNPVTWRRALTHSLSDWYVFALLSIPAVALARRLPIERGRWGAALGAHFVNGSVLDIDIFWLDGAGLWCRQVKRPLLKWLWRISLEKQALDLDAFFEAVFRLYAGP